MSFKNKMGKMHRNEMTFFKKWAKFTHCMSHADTTTLMSTCHLFPPPSTICYCTCMLTCTDVKSHRTDFKEARFCVSI